MLEEACHNFVDKEGHFFLAAKSFEKGGFCGFWRIGLGLGWLCRCILVVFRCDCNHGLRVGFDRLLPAQNTSRRPMGRFRRRGCKDTSGDLQQGWLIFHSCSTRSLFRLRLATEKVLLLLFRRLRLLLSLFLFFILKSSLCRRLFKMVLNLHKYHIIHFQLLLLLFRFLNQRTMATYNLMRTLLNRL